MPASWYARSSQGRPGVADWFIAVVCCDSGTGRVSFSMMLSTA